MPQALLHNTSPHMPIKKHCLHQCNIHILICAYPFRQCEHDSHGGALHPSQLLQLFPLALAIIWKVRISTCRYFLMKEYGTIVRKYSKIFEKIAWSQDQPLLHHKSFRWGRGGERQRCRGELKAPDMNRVGGVMWNLGGGGVGISHAEGLLCAGNKLGGVSK